MIHHPVHFVGAGPGDPELITVKGQKLLMEADVIIYAGSLVSPALLKFAKECCDIHNSANMTLEEVISVVKSAFGAGKKVVRLHTGDPSLYGAIQEQIAELDAVSIPWRVVPGVSSFVAAAAALGQELTLPGVSQTVVITRMEGRTPVPERESLRSLASHQATLCIFLSVHMIDDVARELEAGGYLPDTPVAVVEKASWPEQRVFQGTIKTISRLVKESGVGRTAMVIVGQTLSREFEKSKLYAADFSHMFREAAP